MSLSALPLSYCTNVHPGRSLREVDAGLDEYTAPLRVNYGYPLAAGLWLAAPVVQELLGDAEALPRFKQNLQRRDLTCYTLNAFPYGDFHSQRVKENVYVPDWADERRADYTVDCARILAHLLDEGAEGSISTVPLAFKGFNHPPEHMDRCIAELLKVAAALHQIRVDTGRVIRLAIEPEPFCVLETTPETLRFFVRLRERAADARLLDVATEHLGVCYDVCHQAVEFENLPDSIRGLNAAGIRINKVHVTCALQLDAPAENTEGRKLLSHYAEERYLHQVLARTRNGSLLRHVDLSQAFALTPPRDFLEAKTWRIHFHVPVNAEHLGPLGTTRAELAPALAAIAELNYAPHLEVETYTWGVLPVPGANGLVDGLTQELTSTRALLQTLAGDQPV